MGDTGKELLNVVEIDCDKCSRVYGVLPCRAAVAPSEFRTNILTWSQDFLNAAWNVANLRGTLTPGETAPDLTLTGTEYVENTATGIRQLVRSGTSFTSGIDYTFSIYAKQGVGSRHIGITFPNTAFGTGIVATFNLSDGVATITAGSGTAGSELVNGYWRVWITQTATVTATGNLAVRMSSNPALFGLSYTGDGASSILMWGAQVEVGDGPSTYKATEAAAVTEVWGTGTAKCYNTFGTCQSVPNYALGDPLTLRFATNQSGLPKTGTVFPAMSAAPTTNAGEINLSGIDPRTSALGKRARVTVNLQDFTYHDTLTDPYVADRGYDPAERGTFFSKLFARNPYYVGRSLRVKSGYVGEAFAAMDTRHYVISEWEGPNAAGEVTVTAKDVLDLADNAKSVCPAASRGKLATAITATDTTVTLTPATVGDEYPASGYVSIGREIMGFTRSGDVLTLTARGAWTTSATAHAANDVVQVCAYWINQRPCDVMYDIYTDGGDTGIGGANINPSFMDLPAWQSENDSSLGGIVLTSIIPKPTGCALLIGEICQHGVLSWWDEVAQEIRYRVNRPIGPGEAYFNITDAAHIIRGTLDIERPDDMRATQVHFWHGVIDPTDYAEDGNKFKKLVATIATEEESPNAYGESRIKKIYSRWFGVVGDDGAASVLAERLGDRYRNTPVVISGQMDVKDKSSMSLAALVRVQSYLLTDEHGAQIPQSMQVRYLSERNDRLEFKAETFTFEGRFGFWLDDPTDDYDTASDDDKEFGAYWMDEDIGIFPDGTGPYVYF